MPAKTTLKDIARETGYTVATVSRALSGKDQIAQATREKVRATAERLGYQPDPALSRLSAIRWGLGTNNEGTTIAVLMDNNLDNVPWYVRQRMQGVESRAKALGYQLSVINLNDYEGKAERVAEVLKARGIRGVLIERIFNPGCYDGFPWDDFASIGCGFGMERLPIPTVCNDLYDAVRQLWRLARERGYRRIGVIMSFASKGDPYYRVMSAVTVEQYASELLPDEQVVPPLIYQQPWTKEAMLAAVKQWRESHQPDAIFLSSKAAALLLKNDDLMPLNYACYDWSEGGDCHITRASQSLYATGELAVELCHLELMLPKWHGRHTSTVHLVEPEIFTGETLPACQ